jgi:hypothetical protein
VTAALAPVAPKLALLIPLLASDRDGEALGACRAIGRTLKSAGCDFHDLAAALTTPSPPRRRDAWPPDDRELNPRCWTDIDRPEQGAWLSCMASSHALTRWERNFAFSIGEQIASQPWKSLSPKQIGVLDRLVLKLVGGA